MIKRTPMGRKSARIARKPKIARLRRIKPKKRKRATKADFLRSWGIFPGTWMRYSGIRGIYWFWFSRTVRERDYKEHEGLCITCGKYVEKGSDQACHIFAASGCGFALLFHPLNVHLGHSKCNNPRFTPSAGVFNALNIEKRYGNGTIARLATLKENKTKEWNRQEYEERIRQLPAYQASLQ